MSNYIVETYVRLRKVSKEDEAQKKSHTYTSARTLLGVLRLAQALARLRFSNEVAHADVDEALRLMEVSKRSLVEDEDEGHDRDRSDVSKIFRLIKEMSKQVQSGKKGRKARGARRFGRGPGGEREMDVDSEEEEDTDELSMVDIRSRVLTNGFTEAQLMETILEVCCGAWKFDVRVANGHSAYSTKVSTSGRAWRITQNCVSSRARRAAALRIPLVPSLSISCRLSLRPTVLDVVLVRVLLCSS